VFIESGHALLDRKPPAGYLEKWAEALSAEKDTGIKDAVPVLVFRLGQEWMALGTDIFREVAEMGNIHKIPHCNDAVLMGLVNIRGELQLCFSLHVLLGIETAEDSPPPSGKKISKRMLVAERDKSCWIFPVDEIYGIHRYDQNDLRNVPATISKAAATYTKGVFRLEEKNIGHLDDALLFGALNRRLM
jgi:chemotaxis-related protein WspD